MLKRIDPTSAEMASAEVFVNGGDLFDGYHSPEKNASAVVPAVSADPVVSVAAPAALAAASAAPVSVPEVPAAAAPASAAPAVTLSAAAALSGVVSVPESGAPSAPSFADFALGVYPFLELQPFHRAYYRVLEAFALGRVRRLIVTMPPQHGKSVGATTLLPAYVLGLDPDCRVAIASYSGALASKFNRRVQRILESREYADYFPATTIKKGAKPPSYIRTADEVEIIGRRGGLLSVGREGSLTGNRVDCFILDDLYIQESILSQIVK